tara:strand:+ start:526 stop:699 length:174 start_codon:yes stop_codon:yes gene_type:complete
MTDFDKMTTAIEKLQPNSEWRVKYNNGTVDETFFNSLEWVSSNSLTWTQVKAEMDKL